MRPYIRGVTDESRLRWQDALVPAALLVLGAAELATLRSTGWVASVGLEAVSAAALVLRRLRPMIAVPCSAIPLMLIPLTGTHMKDAATPIFFYVLGLYSLGRYLGRRSALLAFVLTMALVVANFGFDPSDNDWTDVVFVMSLAIPPFAFGRISRKLAEQSEQLARQSKQLRDQAVRDERDRIARELHDVIAHSVSAMVVQTAAAQDLLRTQPERAAELLASVAETGRQALGETGRLLHLVRDEADELGLRPAPGLADVPALVASFRDGGLDVDASLAVPDRPVPGGVDVSAYRVVQEALTNALKYADGPVRLAVSASTGQVRISCSNPVNGRSGAGSGLGLQGMAERIGLLGGTLRHGVVGPEGDRFEVDVVIPVEPVGDAP